MNLPPIRRGAFSAPLSSAPVDGTLLLQRCGSCHAVQYPPRERCGQCLADALAWETIPGDATVLATTTLAHSMNAWFSAHLPWRIASLRLDAGPIVFAHLAASDAAAGTRLRVAHARDASGAWCLVACAGELSTFTLQLDQLGISA